MKCRWCGRIYGDGSDHIAYELFTRYSGFCSEKCRQEYIASENSRKNSSSRPSYSRQKSGGRGFLSFIGKVIKRIIINSIVILVLVATSAE